MTPSLVSQLLLGLLGGIWVEDHLQELKRLKDSLITSPPQHVSQLSELEAQGPLRSLPAAWQGGQCPFEVPRLV